MSQADDMDAIENYLKNTTAITSEAQTSKTNSLAWFSNLSWYSRTVSDDTLAEAKQRRAAFNSANLAPVLPKDEGITDEEVNVQTGEVNIAPIRAGETREPAKGNLLTESGQVAKPGERAAGGKVVPVTSGKASTMPVNSAVPSGPGNRANLIGPGSEGPTVAEWQRFLGISPADGVYGNETKKLTLAWQARNGRKQDGYIGPNTWAVADKQKPPIPYSPPPEPPTPENAAIKELTGKQPVATPVTNPVPARPRPNNPKIMPAGPKRPAPAAAKAPTPAKAKVKKVADKVKSGIGSTTGIAIAAGLGALGLGAVLSSSSKGKKH
jgi:peptidoglycan hydrolase-like protein with peptidoglycan-binding domain